MSVEPAVMSARIKPVPSAKRLITVSGIGLLFDSMDVNLVAYILVAVAAQWHLSPATQGYLSSMGFIGMAVGAALAGLLADRFGRKAVFMWTLLIYSVATGLTAFAWGVGIFYFLRFLVGFGLGGELPVATTYVLESSADDRRGRHVVLLEMFYAFGSLCAALISNLVIPSVGWRVVFLIGAIPALYVLILRRQLPESPRFMSLAERRSMRDAFTTLWAPGVTRSTVVTWVLWFAMNFAFYGMVLWLPSILFLKGYSLVHSLSYTLIMTLAQVPGYLTAAWLVEKWGRKRTLLPAMLCSALAALGFGFAHSTLWLFVFGILVNYFMLGAWAGTYIFTVEQFPTRARASGIGWASGFGRIGAIIAPSLVGLMIGAKIGFGAVFTMFFAMIAIGFLVVWAFGRETLGERLR
ncbi:MFS transporter [Alicyclobacillus macrosporangiidus]|uniref:MFS transporter, putative metabolite:H+ symporter n=1 Tax=Alicyclobacillus macrosporangiidus TaxID=392015 RepID=A0A1I7L3A4_9BACL|nr:MFS transporter [Alicyclobacillus macrosporangiidus]SFV04177.1 MFS transporter, putative metabolite:H+ symporter [Alicyclobacillus macrosporangiidus]